MDFLTKKVLDFQQKKLSEAEKKLQYHLAKKEKLKVVRSDNIKNEIVKDEKMVKIWTKNIDKIKQEIKKIQMK